MVVFPLFFLAFAGACADFLPPAKKEREEPSAGFNTELRPLNRRVSSRTSVMPTCRRRCGAGSGKRCASLQDFAFGMEDEEEEPHARCRAG